MNPSVRFSIVCLLPAFLLFAQLASAHPWASSARHPNNCSINEHPDVVSSSQLICELNVLTIASRQILTASITLATFIVRVFPQGTTIVTCITALTTHQSRPYSSYTASPHPHMTGAANTTISRPMDMASWPLTSSATAAATNLAMWRRTL